jgi:hypothetical protein
MKGSFIQILFVFFIVIFFFGSFSGIVKIIIKKLKTLNETLKK